MKSTKHYQDIRYYYYFFNILEVISRKPSVPPKAFFYLRENIWLGRILFLPSLAIHMFLFYRLSLHIRDFFTSLLGLILPICVIYYLKHWEVYTKIKVRKSRGSLEYTNYYIRYALCLHKKEKHTWEKYLGIWIIYAILILLFEIPMEFC